MPDKIEQLESRIADLEHTVKSLTEMQQQFMNETNHMVTDAIRGVRQELMDAAGSRE